MWTDVIDLRDFYDSPLGRVARRVIRRRIRAIWPDLDGQRVLGLGFATPYLGGLADDADRILAMMPAAQGVIHWPRGAPGRVALVDEAELPLPDLSMDRVLLVHALEHTELLRPMMREVWRVLNDSGRLMVVAPNRRGIWARLERTPFGHGHPYSATQLSRLLRDSMFTPIRAVQALYVPPMRSRMMMGTANAWERIGDRWLPNVAGTILVEAGKQLYIPNAAAHRRVRRLQLALSDRAPRPARNAAHLGRETRPPKP
ncbi:MAG: methyltransferase domain-containing protein [Rhodospirillaceae bacterium]|jgi:SAM-dependent methyltransferase|nr:methyltransferase domain-containing protein [Rhodospirillaceae bacterium]